MVNLFWNFKYNFRIMSLYLTSCPGFVAADPTGSSGHHRRCPIAHTLSTKWNWKRKLKVLIWIICKNIYENHDQSVVLKKIQRKNFLEAYSDNFMQKVRFQKMHWVSILIHSRFFMISTIGNSYIKYLTHCQIFGEFLKFELIN